MKLILQWGLFCGRENLVLKTKVFAVTFVQCVNLVWPLYRIIITCVKFSVSLNHGPSEVSSAVFSVQFRVHIKWNLYCTGPDQCEALHQLWLQLPLYSTIQQTLRTGGDVCPAFNILLPGNLGQSTHRGHDGRMVETHWEEKQKSCHCQVSCQVLLSNHLMLLCLRPLPSQLFFQKTTTTSCN